jgi:hypothetical protein
MVIVRDIVVLLVASGVFFSCGESLEDPVSPARPLWVEKSLPEEWPEFGIDASEGGAIHLEWQASEDMDLRGYHIYRARYHHEIDSLGDMEEIAFISDDLNTDSFTDQSAAGLVRYRYTLTAEDVSGNQSDPADTISYRVLQHVIAETMQPNGVQGVLNTERELSWVYRYYEEMQDYVITVLTQEGELVVRKRFEPGNYIGYIEEWSIPVEFQLEVGQVYKWRIDTNAAYIDHSETQGSESAWAHFVFE